MEQQGVSSPHTRNRLLLPALHLYMASTGMQRYTPIAQHAERKRTSPQDSVPKGNQHIRASE